MTLALPFNRNMSPKLKHTWTMISVTYVNGSGQWTKYPFWKGQNKIYTVWDKCKLRKAAKLNITHHGVDVKQNSPVAYFGCILDETMSSEPVTYKTRKKINSRLNYLFRQNIFWHQA